MHDAFYLSSNALLFTKRWHYSRVRSPSARTRMKWHRYFGLATVFTPSRGEWMDYWSKFWDCGDVAVGRYQHAHAASTYSYTLALSRPPHRRPVPLCNLPSTTLSSFHRFTHLSCPLFSLTCPLSSSFTTFRSTIIIPSYVWHTFSFLPASPSYKHKLLPLFTYWKFLSFFWLPSHRHFMSSIFFFKFLFIFLSIYMTILANKNIRSISFFYVHFRTTHHIFSFFSIFSPRQFFGNFLLTHYHISSDFFRFDDYIDTPFTISFLQKFIIRRVFLF